MSAARDITLTLDEETRQEVTALAAEDGVPIAALIRRVLSGCSQLHTEDLDAGQRFAPPLVVNPFAPGGG